MGTLVSVVIPSYNHEKYVTDAVDSCLSQTYTNLEVIVVDDGSQDHSVDLLRERYAGNHRVRIFTQQHKGAHAALNEGIYRASGKYIAILNSDDIYDPNRIEEALKILERNREVSAVFTYIELINAQGESLGIKRGAEDNWLGQSADDSFRDEHNLVLDLLAGNFLHTTSNLICRREVFDRIGIFANLRYTHDYEFYLRLCTRCVIALIEIPLLKYRFHETNTLNENAAASRFETALVLADFLLTYDLEKVLGEGSQRFQRLRRLFVSMRTYETDRIIVLLFLLGFKGNPQSKFWDVFADGQQNPFREVCIDSLQHTQDLCTLKDAFKWQQGQTEIWWRRAEEARVTLEQRETFMAEQDTLIEELRAKEAVLNEILASRQWRWFQKLNRVRYAVRRACGRNPV